ncbi:bacteriocin [Streptococcus sp. 121]|uniref:bacteriocin n=1 Tax=Streptococcus sp. 121 TaxID=2797637 RepID=UPI0018F09EB6|nr:bacteriocin [Streptococcus sp. 121]MBJ6745184.1 bacteriocin [Streptococcus sp. 121]
MEQLKVADLRNIRGGDRFWGNVFTGAMGGAATGMQLCTVSGPAYGVCVGGFTVIGGAIGGWNT